ncbi:MULTISPECIES: SCO4225 family membrane protein [unclassified Streptomyces]|uniref:SCO4225 family membrane protein n=1 Tax=unclassified Streptomyces TaxID=2593676 RepID=UPI00324745E1
MNGKSPAQRIGRTVAGDWVSRGYLMVIAALLVWVWVDTTLVSHPDASFAGVYPILLTAPGSLLLLLPGIEGPLGWVVLVAAALVNSTVISLIVRRAGGHGSSRRAGPGATPAR